MRAEVLCLVMLLLAARPAGAQISIEPNQPEQGKPFTVIADPAAAKLESERLTKNDQVYAVIDSFEDGVIQRAWAPLIWDGARFAGRGQVPKNSVLVNVRLATVERMLLSVRASFTPRTAGGALPMGAPLPAMMFGDEPSANRRSEIEQELVRSGHLGWPYQFAWRILFWRDNVMSREELLAEMAKVERDRPRTPGLLYALVDGYFLTGEREKGVAVLRDLCRNFPGSPQVVFALIQFADATAVRNGWTEIRDEIPTLYAAVVDAAPENPALWRFGSLRLRDARVTLSTLRKVYAAWRADDPRSMDPDFVLATALARSGANADAEAVVSKAIELGQQPHPFLTASSDNRAPAYRLRSGLRAQRGDLGGALSDITMAQIFAQGSDWTDVETEAKLWQRMGFPKKAEAAAIKAYANGSFTAEALLKELHAGAAEPFDAYLKRQLEEREGILQSARPLPAFTTATLDGVSIDSTALKGQVTVVLFWFIGCPDMTETLPAVRRVAEEFRGRVRFLSFAEDPADRLRDFLKESSFGYEVVPNSQEILRSFGVRSVPQHAVIGIDGRVIWDANPRPADIANRLRAVIERTLARSGR